jgi:hypothetical protein
VPGPVVGDFQLFFDKDVHEGSQFSEMLPWRLKKGSCGLFTRELDNSLANPP